MGASEKQQIVSESLSNAEALGNTGVLGTNDVGLDVSEALDPIYEEEDEDEDEHWVPEPEEISGPQRAVRPQLMEVHVLGRHRRYQRKNDAQDVSLHTISTASGRLLDVRTSTVQNLQNRKTDKERVQREVGLTEFGNTSTAIYYLDGEWLPETKYWDEFADLHTNERPDPVPTDEDGNENWIPTTLLAQGYNRIVYGDHGPYVELSDHQINWAAFPYYKEKPVYSYYDEYFTADGKTMLYAQKKYVTNKKNPPKVGAWSTNNNRPEGYANYVPGYYYIEASRAKLYCVDTRTGLDLGEDADDTDAPEGGAMKLSEQLALRSSEAASIARNLDGSVVWAMEDDHQYTAVDSSLCAPFVINDSYVVSDSTSACAGLCGGVTTPSTVDAGGILTDASVTSSNPLTPSAVAETLTPGIIAADTSFPAASSDVARDADCSNGCSRSSTNGESSKDGSTTTGSQSDSEKPDPQEAELRSSPTMEPVAEPCLQENWSPEPLKEPLFVYQ